MAWPDPFSTRRWTRRTSFSFLRTVIAGLFLSASLSKSPAEAGNGSTTYRFRCQCVYGAIGAACCSLQNTLMHIVTFKQGKPDLCGCHQPYHHCVNIGNGLKIKDIHQMEKSIYPPTWQECCGQFQQNLLDAIFLYNKLLQKKKPTGKICLDPLDYLCYALICMQAVGNVGTCGVISRVEVITVIYLTLNS